MNHELHLSPRLSNIYSTLPAAFSRHVSCRTQPTPISLQLEGALAIKMLKAVLLAALASVALCQSSNASLTFTNPILNATGADP